MATGRQATFGDVSIRNAKQRHNCDKVMGVKDGERIYCDNNAKYRIERNHSISEYRCGQHVSDYSELLKDNE